ncbi:MAG TPA: lipid-A-disaccharide synthase, partial [Coleofasciculaceae cyanobacterium]
MNRPARIFISTGEVSGDLQAALLIEALYRQAELLGLDLDIFALGGKRMAAAGAQLLGNTSEIGSIGILESLPYVLPTLALQRQARQRLQQTPPDIAVLVDYVSPNVAFCGYFSKYLPTVPVVYYIAPQEWIWSFSSYNTNQITRGTDRILAIFPEEARFFEQKGGSVRWVGHPLVDRMQQAPTREQARAALQIPP